MEIEFVGLKRQFHSIEKEIRDAIDSVLATQHFAPAEELNKFEEEFATYLGSKYVVGVDNGSDGLIFTMKVLSIGKGDEVITPVNSYIATTFAITEVGATPIFVDVDPDTHQLDLNQVEAKITSKTKAILPVHLYGAPCQIDELMDLANKNGIHVVEDSCQAHGSKFDNKRLGSFGVLGVFSFYPGKNLGAYGNGGAVCTDDEKLYKKLMSLRDFGMTRRYYHDEIGYNSKLDNLQAAILSVKLKHLDEWNAKRNEYAKLYKKELPTFKTPQILSGGESNYHLFVIECDKRDELQAYLHEKGSKAQIHYPVNIHLQKCYEYLGFKEGDFPVAEGIAKRILSLPIYAELTEEEVSYTAQHVNAFYSS